MTEKLVEEIIYGIVAIVAIWCLWGKPLITINRYYNGKENNESSKEHSDN